MKNESPRQLKTIPLTAAGLAAAQASAAALSKAASRRESNPPHPKADAASVTAAPQAERAPEKASRAATMTIAAIGALAIVCAGAAWTQRNNQTVVSTAPATAAAPAIKEATSLPATPVAQPPVAETAVGFVVAARPSPPGERPAAPAVDVKTETQAAPAPAPATATATPAAEPEPPKRVTTRPRVTAEPAPKADPPAPPPREPAKAKPPERTASAPVEAPKPAPAAAPSSVDAILQQQLKSAIP